MTFTSAGLDRTCTREREREHKYAYLQSYCRILPVRSFAKPYDLRTVLLLQVCASRKRCCMTAAYISYPSVLFAIIARTDPQLAGSAGSTFVGMPACGTREDSSRAPEDGLPTVERHAAACRVGLRSKTAFAASLV
ncbi:hypothetical protein BV20DRAFT_741037 [Pilatotrama ljubarskyi]|nr:hypothetical protein BV20DRAFT_741037 [Pilatotrama ljubarskyi]